MFMEISSLGDGAESREQGSAACVQPEKSLLRGEESSE